MDLKQDFWSILGHKTYLAPGLRGRNANNVITMLIPVATGNTKHDVALRTP